MASVSACLIVRDEEAVLGACLDSLQGAVDEICVVDTGSTDRTVKIAREHGAKIGHYAWCDDFSAARNAALDLATGDWILSIDADERLLSASAVREACERDVTGHYVTVIADDSLCYRTPRLFRNRADLRYSGVIHEMPPVEIGTWGISEVALQHVGYTRAIMQAKGKQQRNLRLLDKQIQLTPRDPFPHFNRGALLLAEGEADAAEISARHALALWRENPVPDGYVPQLYLVLAKAVAKQGRPDEALAILYEGGTKGANAEIPFVMAEILLSQGRHQEALGLLFRARDLARRMLSGEVLYGAVDPALATWRTDEAIGQVLFGLDQREAAVFHLERAKAERPVPNPNIDRLLAACRLPAAV